MCEHRYSTLLLGFDVTKLTALGSSLAKMDVRCIFVTTETLQTSLVQRVPLSLFMDASVPLQEALRALSFIRSVIPSMRVHCFREVDARQEQIALLQNGATSVSAKIDINTEVERLMHGHIAKLQVAKNGHHSTRLPMTGGIASRLRATEIVSIAKHDIDMLIVGAHGNDSADLAKEIHHLSPRASQPFVTIDCASLSENLAESELFGHTKGAFSGADKERLGLMRSAEGGTLLLNKVEDLSASIQAKLLRALQEREVRPVGAMRSYSINVRIISTSNVDLAFMVASGDFREDLLFRISAYSCKIPNLNDRRDEIPSLVRRYLKSECERMGMPLVHMDAAATAELMGADWPGNSRQLRNVLQNAVFTCTDSFISVSSIKELMKKSSSSPVHPYSESLQNLRALHLRDLHAQWQGSTSKMVQAGSLHRSTVYRMMSTTAH